MKFLFVLKVLNQVLKVLFRLASPEERKKLGDLRSDCITATASEEIKSKQKASKKVEEVPFE